jgi:GNAT superfamily N-acetyltransferase
MTGLENSLVIRDARKSDYGFLCDVFAQSHADHLELRSDLYRQDIGPVMSPFQFNMLMTLRDGRFTPSVVSRKFQRTYYAGIAALDGKPVGAVFAIAADRLNLSWSVFPSVASVENIAVLPEHRRQGIGAALLTRVFDWAREQGHPYCDAKVLSNNDASRALFAKAGFAPNFMFMGREL